MALILSSEKQVGSKDTCGERNRDEHPTRNSQLK